MCVNVTRSGWSKEAVGNIQCARGKVVLTCLYCVLGITYIPTTTQQKPQTLASSEEVIFFIHIYLQHVPLHGNTTCSSVHVIHCLSFWSVIGTTSRDLCLTSSIFRKSIELTKIENACRYLVVSSSFTGGQNPPLSTIFFIMGFFVPRKDYSRRLCGWMPAVLHYRERG